MRSKKKPITKEGNKAKWSFEQFRAHNRARGKKLIKQCLQTDAEKVAAGTHKWIVDGKIRKLVRIV